MKQGHFMLIFLLIACFCFFKVYAEQEKYRQAEEEKQRLEESLLIAVERTAEKMKDVLYAGEETKLFTLEEVFYESWFLQLGISGDKETQEKMRMYVPMIAWLEEEGGFFYFTEEVREAGVANIEQKWSECIPYSLEGNTVDRAQVIAYLEQYASNIMTEHNRIARQYGIQYSFYVPYFLGAQTGPLIFPILIVVVQGWPLEASGEILYANCVDANAYIKETETYLVELSDGVEERYVYFHKKDCEQIIVKENVLQEQLCKEEAQELYGALPCPYCFSDFLMP